MVKPPPAAPFVMIEAYLVLEFLEVALDAPADLREPDELVERDGLRDGRDPLLRRSRCAFWPFDQQPLDLTRFGAPVIAVRWTDAHGGEARRHRPLRALAPSHLLPSGPRQATSDLFRRSWLVSGRSLEARRGSPPAPIDGRWQRCFVGRPKGRLGLDAHDVRQSS